MIYVVCFAMAVLCSLFVYILVMLWRNNLVYRTRIGMINNDFEGYKNAASYDAMMYNFRAWTRKSLERTPR